MRIDHLAYRVASRAKAVKFFEEAFGYKCQSEFEIFFNEEKTDKALCIALEPPEKPSYAVPFSIPHICKKDFDAVDYHMAPEIFVSEGTQHSIVWNWVQYRGGIGGIHHIAYEVADVEAQRKLWIERDWGDFSSAHAFKCDDLTQIFTKAHAITGIIYEFIERKGFGFCTENVKKLMESTAKIDGNIK